MNENPPPERAQTFRRAAVLLFAAAVVWQVLIPPVVGLADNWDYSVVSYWYRLDPVDPPYPDHAFKFLPLKFREGNGPRLFRLITSEILLTAPPFLLSKLCSKDGLYDLRWSGAMHAVLYLCAAWLALGAIRRWPGWRKWAGFGVLFFLFTDVVYVSYLNSLYTDAASLLALLLVAASWVYLIGERRKSIAIVFLLSCLLLVTSKAQHAVLGIPLVLFLGWKRRLLFSTAGKRTTVALVALIAASTFTCMIAVPKDYRALAFYNVVFYRVAPDSGSPREAMKELGLPDWYVVYSGTHSYSPTSPMLSSAALREDVARPFSYVRLGLYYLRHPGSASRLILRGLDEAAPQREKYLGNFPKSAGFAPGAQSSAFALWSGIKKGMFETHPVLLATALASFLLIAGVLLCKEGGHGLHSLGLLGCWMVLELGVSCLTDCLQTGRHLFLFMTMGDIALAAVALLAIGRMEVHPRERRDVGRSVSRKTGACTTAV